MNVRGETIARGVEACKLLCGRYLAGFTEDTRTAQPPALPNHPAWCLGHLALTMHRVAEKLDGVSLPDADFGRTGFTAESVAFGSAPVAQANAYPPLPRCIEIYNGACDRLSAALRAATDAQLDQRTPWVATDLSLEALCLRMIFHNGMHTGQIADTRRALGMKSIFA